MEKVKFGVFGLLRGMAFVNNIEGIEEAEVVALLEQDPERIEEAKKHCPETVKVCKDFDELLNSGIDAVILCNYFHEHARYAIKAAKAGIHVLSETIPAVTLKECVELVEAVEESGILYALAENYPFFRANQEMARVYQSGMVGDVIFAEGEYIHPMEPEELEAISPGDTHWRKNTPATFYSTHAMAPLMKITNLMPKKVIGKVAAGWQYNREHGADYGDNYGVLLCEMENGAVFRADGCGNFGPHGNWYRLGCSHGGVESVRGSNDKVRLCINNWNQNEETKYFGTEAIYTPEVNDMVRRATRSGHSGGDFWVTWTFVQDVLHNRQPYMDVYRSAALSAVAILGWQSSVDGSKELDIPDFRDPAAREEARKNDLTPYYVDGKAPIIPAFRYPGKKV